jgi:GAF domain-containing protein
MPPSEIGRLESENSRLRAELVLQVLSTIPLSLKDQGFYLPLWKDRRPVYSDDVAHDPHFSHELFRLIPHQSGLLLPLILDAEVAGAFYLVWWTVRRRFTDGELALMETVTGQVTLLLRNVRLYEEVQIQRRNLADRVRDLEEALARIKQLQGLLPICAWCKKVRNDQNYWQTVEGYLAEHTETRFSHSICPDCREKLVARRNANG